jgi:hypothetical protein
VCLERKNKTKKMMVEEAVAVEEERRNVVKL